MKDMLSCRLVEIDKAEAPARLAASYMSTVKFHNHSHLESTLTFPKVGKLARIADDRQIVFSIATTRTLGK